MVEVDLGLWRGLIVGFLGFCRFWIGSIVLDYGFGGVEYVS